MAAPLQIRNVPDDVRRTLKSRAAARGESLNNYLLDLMARDASRPTVTEVLDRAARRAGRPASPVLETLDAVRRDRDEQLTGRTSR